MKKVKKMASGGLSDMLGGLTMQTTKPPGFGVGTPVSPSPMPGKGGGGGGGGGGSASDGLGTVNQGAQAIGSALGRASEAIGGGGGGGSNPPPYMYKKGGKVTTTRISTASRSKKSPNW
jgi:hypothetical protein